jgi:hypothetical protein
MNESLHESLTDFSILESLSFDKAFKEMFGYELGSFGSSMSIKDSKECEIFKLWNCEVGNVRVFHVSPPALHLAGGETELLVLFKSSELVSDGFLEERLIAHGVLDGMKEFK